MKILYASFFPIDELRKIGKDVHELSVNNEFFLFPLVYYFWKRGDDIVIVSSSRQIRRQEEYTQERLKIIVVPLCRHGRVSAFLEFRNDIIKIEKAISENCSDIYHAHWCYEYAKACINVNPDKTIVTMHDWPDKVCPLVGNYYWNKRNKLGNDVIEHALRFTAVSPYSKESIKTVKKEACVDVVPNFIQNADVIQNDDTAESDHSFDIIMVNNGFGDIKNTKIALKSFVKFHKSVTESTLSMYGDDYGVGEKAQKWAVENNVDTDGVRFKGKVGRNEIYAAYRKADVLLHTSREESFGLIYLEAMISETVIIAGKNSGATPWVLEEGKCGCLVDVEDESSIINGLNQIYSNKEYRQGLVEMGKVRIKDFYSDRVFSQYGAVYDEQFKRVDEVN